MRTPLMIVVVALSMIVLGHSRLSAAEVGQSKSFRGPTGLQLYSLRNVFKEKGVAPTLDMVRQWRFKYVEVAGTYGMTIAEFKAELDKRGLVPIGSHFPFNRLRDDIDGVIREAKSIGPPCWTPARKSA